MPESEIRKCCICNKPITEEWAYEEPYIPSKLSSNLTIIDEYVCSNCNDEDIKTEGVMLKILRAMHRTVWRKQDA